MTLSLLRRPHVCRHASGSTRLQRRARDLMSLSSLMMFVSGIGWLVIAASLAMASNGASPHAGRTLAAFRWLPAPQADHHVLALAWLSGCAATLAPLVALRRLGKTLWQNPVLNPDMARRFRAFARALLFSLFGGWLAAALASTQVGQYRIGFGMGTWSLLAAILLAYIVAELVSEGAAATAENHDFI